MMSHEPSGRIYFDNAATSFPKPQGVYDGMARYASDLGASAGRGAYREALQTGQLIQQCRQRLNRLFNGERAEHFIFALNCSDALNLGIKGILHTHRDSRQRPHAICTQIDHNSILRPLGAMEDRGECDVTRIAIDPSTGLVDPDDVRRAIQTNTRLIAITHASNVTGTIQPIREIGQIAREHNIPFLVDAAQSAGHLPIDVQADCIDLLAAPGHKALLGPLGTGFLYIRPGLEGKMQPLREGGTGSVSENDRQPEFMPDKFEPGSHNAIGIIGLSEGAKWISEQGVAKLAEHDRSLSKAFIDGVSSVEGLTFYGPQGLNDRLGVFSVRIEGFEPYELAAILESNYGLLTRPGLHCAPLVHNALGTTAFGGTTRFSFGAFLTIDDVRIATDALAEIAMSRAAV